ncbi:MAG: HD domain-containing protein [Candidatus Delongbacteria bacterium]|nr:HD domain-containing protein [Candidatus Delongbacteria bacterium]
MIAITDVEQIKEWFDQYVDRFFTGYEAYDSALSLKKIHTENVVLNSLELAEAMNLNRGARRLVDVMATLHDVGRFEQYARYGTYSDLKSEDHARLGLEIVEKNNVLHRLPYREREMVRMAIAYHSAAVLPSLHDLESILYLKLLRDADKIDILRVVTDHYDGLNVVEAIEIELPDRPDVSDRVVESLKAGRIVKIQDVKTLSDFKLLQISWVFDLNFKRSFEIINERRYLERLSSGLPPTEPVLKAVDAAKTRLRQCSA